MTGIIPSYLMIIKTSESAIKSSLQRTWTIVSMERIDLSIELIGSVVINHCGITAPPTGTPLFKVLPYLLACMGTQLEGCIRLTKML